MMSLTYPIEKEHSWQRCLWESQEFQYIRFDVLSAIGDLRNRHVLDVGCGDGEMCRYLKGRYQGISYTGVDCNPDMFSAAMKRLPTGVFIIAGMADVSTMPDFDNKYDYAFLSGVFNGEGQGIEDYVYCYLPKLFYKVKLGVAINFLNAEYEHRHPDFHMWSPQNMASFATTFCNNVQIRKDYLPNDFTLYLRK